MRIFVSLGVVNSQKKMYAFKQGNKHCKRFNFTFQKPKLIRYDWCVRMPRGYCAHSIYTHIACGAVIPRLHLILTRVARVDESVFARRVDLVQECHRAASK